jgi:hypothetical protein
MTTGQPGGCLSAPQTTAQGAPAQLFCCCGRQLPVTHLRHHETTIILDYVAKLSSMVVYALNHCAVCCVVSCCAVLQECSSVDGVGHDGVGCSRQH